MQEHCRSVRATGMQKAIRNSRKLHIIYKGLSSASWAIWSTIDWKDILGKTAQCIFLLASPSSKTHDWMDSGLQETWPYMMLLYKQNNIKDSNAVFQKQNYMRIAVSGQTWLCPKPGKSAVRLGLSALFLQTRLHTRSSGVKGKSNVTSLWAAGLPYRDLLCPLVTIKQKTGNIALSQSIKIQSCYICWLVHKQWSCSDFVWPNWEYPSPGHHCLRGM